MRETLWPAGALALDVPRPRGRLTGRASAAVAVALLAVSFVLTSSSAAWAASMARPAVLTPPVAQAAHAARPRPQGRTTGEPCSGAGHAAPLTPTMAGCRARPDAAHPDKTTAPAHPATASSAAPSRPDGRSTEPPPSHDATGPGGRQPGSTGNPGNGGRSAHPVHVGALAVLVRSTAFRPPGAIRLSLAAAVLRHSMFLPARLERPG